jgi:hypothetical protein
MAANDGAEGRKSLFAKMLESADEDERRFIAQQQEQQVFAESAAQEMADKGVPSDKRPI